MDGMFDLLLILGVLSVLYGVLGLLAGLVDKTGFLRCWLRRAWAESIF